MRLEIRTGPADDRRPCSAGNDVSAWDDGDAVEEFLAARTSPDRFERYAAHSRYGELINHQRAKAIEAAACPTGSAPKTLKRTAHALQIPVADLKMLPRVPENLVLSGKWRPRSLNIEFIRDDATGHLEESEGQQKLDALSKRITPPVQNINVPFLEPVYHVLGGKIMPEAERRTEAVAAPIADLARWVDGWSERFASELQRNLRLIAKTLSPTGINLRVLASLDEPTQRGVLLAVEKLSGTCIDADKFVTWARSGRVRSHPRNPAWANAYTLRSSVLHRIARILDAAATTMRTATSQDDWQTFALHIELMGRVGKKGTVGSGPMLIVMLPTLEQVKHSGRVDMRVASKMLLFDTAVGGLALTSRGGETKARLGVVSGQISAYEEHITLGVPNWASCDIGEDYTYGPFVSLSKSSEFLGFLLPGIELRFFHPAMGPLSRPARRAAERILIAYDDLKDWIRRHRHRDHHPIRDHHPLPNVPSLDQARLPKGQRWSLAKEKLDRGKYAQNRASRYLERLNEVSPQRFKQVYRDDRTVGAGWPSDSRVDAYHVIVDFLRSLTKHVGRAVLELTALAETELQGHAIDHHRVTELTAEVQQHAEAFEFVDALLSPIMEKAPAKQ
ncbi:MAG: hypothetical protein IPK13_17115 [Deltaproteobacteria bacterium]|nr:hypothetical protein [Deltaproteobacteria bacterium]